MPDTLKVLASVAQGFQLRLNVEKLEIPLNPQVGASLVMASNQARTLTKGLKFRVAGPSEDQAEEEARRVAAKAQGRREEAGCALLASGQHIHVVAEADPHDLLEHLDL
jgi:hypothetical protein